MAKLACNAGLLPQQELRHAVVVAESHWETVDLASLSTGACRTVGAEAVA